VSEVFHYAGTVENPRVSGRDPQGPSYYTFASFEDPDGNEWLLQEIKTRLPGREWNLTRPQAMDVALPSGSQYNDIRAQWYSRIFNSVNWLSFMINEKVINDKKMIEHMKPVIISYYENMFLKNASADERDTEF
jgi:hypothetical protein